MKDIRAELRAVEVAIWRYQGGGSVEQLRKALNALLNKIDGTTSTMTIRKT